MPVSKPISIPIQSVHRVTSTVLRITVAMKVTVSPWEISGNVGQAMCKLSHLAQDHEKCHIWILNGSNS